jgi:hypothetical protein
VLGDSIASSLLSTIVQYPHRHHQIVLAMLRILTADVFRLVVSTIGIVKTAETAHSLPTSIFIPKPDVRHTRHDRVAAIAAGVTRQITIVQILSTVIGTITFAIAMTITQPVVPAAAVIRLTRPVRPMSVVKGDAIPFVKYVYQRRHLRLRQLRSAARVIVHRTSPRVIRVTDELIFARFQTIEAVQKIKSTTADVVVLRTTPQSLLTF